MIAAAPMPARAAVPTRYTFVSPEYGAAAGLIVVFVVMKVLNAVVRLQNVSFIDAISFVGGLSLVMAATAVATYYPARRATRVDPSQALRADP
jgi:ABC-type antimicrobial peptide transport system permease subunit